MRDHLAAPDSAAEVTNLTDDLIGGWTVYRLDA